MDERLRRPHHRQQGGDGEPGDPSNGSGVFFHGGESYNELQFPPPKKLCAPANEKPVLILRKAFSPGLCGRFLIALGGPALRQLAAARCDCQSPYQGLGRGGQQAMDALFFKHARIGNP